MLQASGHDLRILSNLSTYLRLPIGWCRAVVWSIDITHPRIIDFIVMAFQKPLGWTDDDKIFIILDSATESDRVFHVRTFFLSQLDGSLMNLLEE